MARLPSALRLMRLTPGLMLVGGMALTVEGGDAPPSGWVFTPGPHQYLYRVRLDVDQGTAGDTLRYASTMEWKLALARTAGSAQQITLSATIYALKATLDGPASHHHIDTEAPTAEALHDPLLGHLFELSGPGFIITLDPSSGAVHSVTGGDQVAQAIAKREPSSFGPDDPSPLQPAANAAYSPSALAALWSQLLALPGGGEQSVALAPPLSGTLVRHWSGLHYTLSLPAGTDHLPVTLGSGPMAVSGSLSACHGGGLVAPRAGDPFHAEGQMEFTLTLTALGQPVIEHEKLAWSLDPLPR